MKREFAGLTGTLLVGAFSLSATAAELRSIEVDGTEFRVTLTAGRVLRSTELVGATLTITTSGGILRLRIDAVERVLGNRARAGLAAFVLDGDG